LDSPCGRGAGKHHLRSAALCLERVHQAAQRRVRMEQGGHRTGLCHRMSRLRAHDVSRREAFRQIQSPDRGAHRRYRSVLRFCPVRLHPDKAPALHHLRGHRRVRGRPRVPATHRHGPQVVARPEGACHRLRRGGAGARVVHHGAAGNVHHRELRLALGVHLRGHGHGHHGRRRRPVPEGAPCRVEAGRMGTSPDRTARGQGRP